MRRFSAASVPPIFMNLTREQEDEVVYCHGTTAKLHARSGVFDDERLVSDLFRLLEKTNL